MMCSPMDTRFKINYDVLTYGHKINDDVLTYGHKINDDVLTYGHNRHCIPELKSKET
jgi:hypothetical protein